MNYLAHARLSFDDPEILAGNMISDYVKGKKQFDYPPRIHAGIKLHRQIDSFTDEHPATKEAKEFFRPHYRLYSGAFIDVVYDHFLATDSNEFSLPALLDFSLEVYRTLERQKEWLPVQFATFFPYMKEQNWLYHYHTLQGTEKSFGGIVRRSTYLRESSTAYEVFIKYYQPLQDCYRQFWSEVKDFARREFDALKIPGNL